MVQSNTSVNTDAPLHTLFKNIARDYPQGRHRQELYEIVRITLREHVLGHGVSIKDLMSKYHVWSSYVKQKGIDVKYAEELDDYLHGRNQTVCVHSSVKIRTMLSNFCMRVLTLLLTIYMMFFMTLVINVIGNPRHS
jgi:hypothetical protein